MHGRYFLVFLMLCLCLCWSMLDVAGQSRWRHMQQSGGHRKSLQQKARSQRRTYLTQYDFARVRRHPPRDAPRSKKMKMPENRFEGCIKKLSQDKFESFISTTKNLRYRDAGVKKSPLFADPIPDRYQLWPGGIVPYQISSSFSQNMRDIIAAAIQDFKEYTCIQFVPRTSKDNSYVFITPGTPGEGCYSDTVGRSGGQQTLNLEEPGCSQKGTAIHELLHVIGMFHEHSRSDRDNHITIEWGNIAPTQRIQFSKHSIPLLESLNSPYDFHSVMHYPADAFSWNGRRTIITKPNGISIGQRSGFSPIDAEEVNKLYCPGQVAPKRPGSGNGPSTNEIIDIELPEPDLGGTEDYTGDYEVLPSGPDSQPFGPPAPPTQPWYPHPRPDPRAGNWVQPPAPHVYRPEHRGHHGPWSPHVIGRPGNHYVPQQMHPELEQSFRQLAQHPFARQLMEHPVAHRIGEALRNLFG